jgi:tetratricopeptide (TPR) repeat protein
MRTKVKLTKQQIKEDRFTNFMFESREWFLDNWQMVAIVAAIIILAIVGSVYYFRMQSGKEVDAAVRLGRAAAELQQRNYQVAILEFKSLSDEFGGRTGGKALFYLGNAYYGSKNYDEAINAFKKYIDKSHIDPLTTASAIAGIAVCLECKQEFLAAADKFNEAIKYYPESPAAPDYYLGAVRNYVQCGDKAQAEKTLKELEKEYPGTESARTAARIIMSLKTN